jgi:anti-anti-sigma factor
MALHLKSRFVGNVYIIQCAGRIVLGDEAKILEAALDGASLEFVRLVLNLSEVERLDSIAMGLLVRFADRMNKQGGGLRLAAPPAFVVNLLNMTKLSGFLLCYPTEDEAIVSFLKQRSAEEAQGKRGGRVLVVEESADLCLFVKTVLVRHGFDVRSTCSFRDAKILLQVDEVDYILVGAGSPQLPAEMVLSSLKALAPRAVALRLDADFKGRDASAATDALLRMFGASGVS